jgi:hypothetical protein
MWERGRHMQSVCDCGYRTSSRRRECDDRRPGTPRECRRATCAADAGPIVRVARHTTNAASQQNDAPDCIATSPQLHRRRGLEAAADRDAPCQYRQAQSGCDYRSGLRICAGRCILLAHRQPSLIPQQPSLACNNDTASHVIPSAPPPPRPITVITSRSRRESAPVLPFSTCTRILHRIVFRQNPLVSCCPQSLPLCICHLQGFASLIVFCKTMETCGVAASSNHGSPFVACANRR